MRIQVEISIPLIVTNNIFEQLIVQEMHRELSIHKKLFDGFTASWSQASKPNWKIDIGGDADSLIGTIQTNDTPFVFVAGGTETRHAIVSPDKTGYKPKTTVGSLRSRSGGMVHGRRGYPLVRRSIQARPIAARNPHFLIAERREKPFIKRMQAVMVKGSNKFFTGQRKIVKVLSI